MERSNILIFIEEVSEMPSVVRYGLNLARQLDSMTVLFDVEGPPSDLGQGAVRKVGSMGTQATHIDTVVSNAQQALLDLKARALKIWPHTEIAMEVGFPVTQLEEASEKWSSDMLVLERHGTPSAFEAWFGSFATDVVQQSDIPVLVLPTETTWKKPGRLAYLMDRDDDGSCLPILRNLIHQFGADLMLIMQSGDLTPERDPVFLSKIKEFQMVLPPSKVKYHSISEASAQDIQKITEEQLVDWMICPKQEAGFFERFFGDALQRELVLNSSIPILTL